MEYVRPETLAFVAPGLLHHLGNVLFTIQGNAQVLGGGEPIGRERAAIQTAAERGAAALQVLRWLTGDHSAPPVQAGVLLQQLGELLRVPVREARQTLELRHGARQTPVFVDGGAFTVATFEAARQVLAVVPAGVRGTLVVDLCDQGERHATLRVSFHSPAGDLPFPLAVDEAVAGVLGQVERMRIRPAVRAHGTGIELVFPGRAAPRVAEA